jgi:type IV fimbrial biogenesis protein FimT
VLGEQEGRIVLILRTAQLGMSIIELMIGLVIMSIVLMVAVPTFTIFLQNQQIRNAAESTLAGLSLARTEAVRRNQAVRFQFVSDLTAGCVLSTTSLAWVVSLANPTGACQVAPSETVAPQIIQTRSASEGARNAVVLAIGGTTSTFNGIGTLNGAGITAIDFSNSTGVCEHIDAVNGKMRCLRVLVSTGGQARMCDPKVAAPVPPDVDPRAC